MIEAIVRNIRWVSFIVSNWNFICTGNFNVCMDDKSTIKLERKRDLTTHFFGLFSVCDLWSIPEHSGDIHPYHPRVDMSFPNSYNLGQKSNILKPLNLTNWFSNAKVNGKKNNIMKTWSMEIWQRSYTILKFQKKNNNLPPPLLPNTSLIPVFSACESVKKCMLRKEFFFFSFLQHWFTLSVHTSIFSQHHDDCARMNTMNNTNKPYPKLKHSFTIDIRWQFA